MGTTYAELKKSLRSDNLSRLYLLLGPEEFLARRLIAQIVDLSLGDGLKDFNFAELDTPTVDPPALFQEINAYPLGSCRRVVVIRHINSLPAPTQEALQDCIADLPDFLTLILTSDRIDRRKTLYKAIAQQGTVVEVGALRAPEAKAWIREMLRERGKKITADIVDAIFELTGSDLSDISNEVNNLLEYLGERETVQQEDIEALVSSRKKEPIYKLTECIAERNLMNAWVVLRQLITEGEQELRILWHLDFMVKRLLRARCLLEEGVPDDAVTKALQVKPFLKQRFLRQVRSFSLDELRRMYHVIVEWDNKFKSTSRWHPDIDLELLVRELCVTQAH
ncbi:MAG: DNA polymerase III subunit delta [Candidatus Abyssobacteria bacterium SURF_17]|uniref:DNA polymerase III subunit delta n=1 Tax=Candidatus Abyssobacteria bacterium SURF_17 TaxID=2093361 RepID=A0A419EQL2_9BACT|nr:MAG: DNA polymerase III subunit delta [Candidatus Abyssubacteria bacterium SURF_17]